MSHFTMEEMLTMQKALQEQYKGRWEPICPATGKNKMLWMIGEISEAADVIKKNGEEKALSDPALRQHLVEELADALMHYNDVLLCYGIGEEELKESYEAKFRRNMNRW